jgi:hypothetical protein
MKKDVIRRSGPVSAIAVFILFGAVLPNVGYLGHTQPTPSHNHATQQPNTPQDSSSGEEHTLHCHAGPAGCAGAQAMVGAIWVGEDSKLIAPPSETRTAPYSSQPSTPEAHVFPILEPPRTV